MAYDKKKLFEKAKEIALEEDCYFIEQLVSKMPISRKSFYQFYPIGSDESNTIKELLDKNKISIKTKMYKKWFDSENPTLQVGFMKLIASEEEAHRLNGSKQEVKQETTHKIDKDTVQTLERLESIISKGSK